MWLNKNRQDKGESHLIENNHINYHVFYVKTLNEDYYRKI